MNADAYARAGVNIAAGDALVEAIKPAVRSTKRPGSDPDLGGFGGLFDLAACGFRDPVLVAATDGVGTKLLLAIEAGRFEGVGVDLVAMCVNDLVVQGAQPLFFLDYLATGKLDPVAARQVVESIAAGCREAGCALIGGETAEMPGLYRSGEFDLAGFSVGAVERDAVLPRPLASGDILLGLASNGLHSNGFSLVRKLLSEAEAGLDDPCPFDDQKPLAEAVLVPTKIYVRSCLAAIATGHVKALAHITGGGLIGNVPRMLSHGQSASIDVGAWTLPPVFGWLARAGRLSATELGRTFNSGIGMVLACAPEHREAVTAALVDAGETVLVIGQIVASESSVPHVELVGTDKAWACCASGS